MGDDTLVERHHEPATTRGDGAGSPGLAPPNSAHVAAGHHRPLNADLRASMEAAFGGADFGSVRVVENANDATPIGAAAFTRGDQIHFAPGHYQPGTPEGNRLLAHELTHVIQQRAARVQASRLDGGVPVNDDPELEQEADRMGDHAVETSYRP